MKEGDGVKLGWPGDKNNCRVLLNNVERSSQDMKVENHTPILTPPSHFHPYLSFYIIYIHRRNTVQSSHVCHSLHVLLHMHVTCTCMLLEVGFCSCYIILTLIYLINFLNQPLIISDLVQSDSVSSILHASSRAIIFISSS